MTVYMDLENLLKEKNISKNKVCEACNLQRTQLNNYCKNKVTRIDFSILAKLCEYLDCTPNPDKPEKLFLFSTPCVILKKKGVFICYSLINTLIKFMASLPVMTA